MACKIIQYYSIKIHIRLKFRSLGLQIILNLQEKICSENNLRFQDQDLEVLVEGEKNGKFFGRSRLDKLVYLDGDKSIIGQLIMVKILESSPWSLYGRNIGSKIQSDFINVY